jgi:hypothetical protein
MCPRRWRLFYFLLSCGIGTHLKSSGEGAGHGRPYQVGRFVPVAAVSVYPEVWQFLDLKQTMEKEPAQMVA